MKRKIGVICLAVLVASGICALFGRKNEQTGLFWQWFSVVYPGRLPNYNDCDEKWVTEQRLRRIRFIFIEMSLSQKGPEKDAMKRVKNIAELWSIFQGKKMVPDIGDPDYAEFILDGWNRPFELQVLDKKNFTIVRISSTASRAYAHDQWVELIIEEHASSVKSFP